ncbi:MAG TPA: hypothetical protein VEB42_02195 [Chitinophagaceae bacterium]|nr:hypothetical protein [Chitinophagaceae bacterium]
MYFFTRCIILILIVANSASAQETAIVSNRDSAFYRNRFFDLRPSVVINGKKLTGEQSTLLFCQVPAADIAYRKFRKRYRTGLYVFGGFFTSLVIAAIAFDQGDRRLASAGLTVSTGSFIAAITFQSSGDIQLRKAIKAYNKQLSFY